MPSKKKRKKPDPAVRRPSLHFDNEKKKWQLIESKSDKGRLCRVLFCRRDARVEICQKRDGRIQRITHRHCDCCVSRRWRANNPGKNAFKELRRSAKRREIPFTLTYAQFLKIIEGTLYLTFTGNKSSHLTIDRIQARVGYEYGNCRVIPRGHNAGKGNIERAIPDPDNIPF